MTSSIVEKAKAALRDMVPDGAASGGYPRSVVRHGAFAQGDVARHDRRPEVVRIVDDDPLVVIHGQDGITSEVFFAVFRFEAGELVEQWFFSVPAASPNRSGHSQIDGPTAPDMTQDTAITRQLVRDYYETVHLADRQDRIDDYMADDRQIRHEPGVLDGVGSFKRDLAELTRSRKIDEVVLLAAEWNFAFIAARGTHGGEPCAYLDLYRVENGKLVEHWGFPDPDPLKAGADAPGLL